MFRLVIDGVHAFRRFRSEPRDDDDSGTDRGFVVSGQRSEYSDVTDMFRLLKSLDEGSVAFRRQREAIVERSLPIADHIARRFSNRGEPLDDLVQVARVGLVNAVNRFDVETGSEFLVIRRADHDGRGTPPLPRLRVGGQSTSPSQRPSETTGSGPRGAVATAWPRADGRRDRGSSWHRPRTGCRRGDRRQQLLHTVLPTCRPDRTTNTHRSVRPSATSTPTWMR